MDDDQLNILIESENKQRIVTAYGVRAFAAHSH